MDWARGAKSAVSMSESSKVVILQPDECLITDDKMVVQLSASELRQLIAEEIVAALQNGIGHGPEKDRLLTSKEAAEILGQNVRWLYRHASKLPFCRRLSRKCLRFSERALRRWLTARST